MDWQAGAAGRSTQLLGLLRAEIRERNDVHTIAGSTTDMLDRLDEVLARRLDERGARIGERAGLRDEIGKYRTRVARRAGALRARRGMS